MAEKHFLQATRRMISSAPPPYAYVFGCSHVFDEGRLPRRRIDNTLPASIEGRMCVLFGIHSCCVLCIEPRVSMLWPQEGRLALHIEAWTVKRIAFLMQGSSNPCCDTTHTWFMKSHNTRMRNEASLQHRRSRARERPNNPCVAGVMCASGTTHPCRIEGLE